MSRPADLTVIIPVHNAADTIEQTVSAFLSLETVHTEVIVVDDNSTDGTGKKLRHLDEQHDRVIVKSHRRNRGAGIARNTGFANATGRYTIFFDADDILHGAAIESVVPLLDQTGADTAIMPYRYRRGRSFTHEAMNAFDDEVWQSYLRSVGATHRVGVLDEFPRLLGFSNYPWNKVVRTEHFRAAGLRYGSTPVHNDILGHWYSLLFARTLLLLDEEICTHIVEEGGSNLSNQRSEVRLSLLDALDETYDLLDQFPALRNRYSHHYWSSTARVAAWAESRIAPEFADEFRLRLQEHILRVNLADFTRMRIKRDPSLANLLLKRSLS